MKAKQMQMSKKQKFINPWAWLSAAPKALSLRSWTGQRERAPLNPPNSVLPTQQAGTGMWASVLSALRAGREGEAQRFGENPSSSPPYAAHRNYCSNHGKQHLKPPGILPAVVVSFSWDKNTLLNSLKCFFKSCINICWWKQVAAYCLHASSCLSHGFFVVVWIYPISCPYYLNLSGLHCVQNHSQGKLLLISTQNPTLTGQKTKQGSTKRGKL